MDLVRGSNFVMALFFILSFIAVALSLKRQRQYCEYVEECKSAEKRPLDYVSWKKLTGRVGII